jgi:hypothetical protein
MKNLLQKLLKKAYNIGSKSLSLLKELEHMIVHPKEINKHTLVI